MAAVGSCRAKAPRGGGGTAAAAGGGEGRAGRRGLRSDCPCEVALVGVRVPSWAPRERSRAAAVRPVDEVRAAPRGEAGAGAGAHACPRSPSLGRRRRQEAAVEEEVEETLQEKKLRLAKLYLEELRQHEEERAAAEEEEETHPADLIGDRLKEDVLEQKGRLQRLVDKDVSPPDPASIRVLRGHQLPVTCLVISPDDRFIFSASKDGSLIKWEVESGKRPCVVPRGKKGTEERHMGHASHVLCVAISSDGKYLVRERGLVLPRVAEGCWWGVHLLLGSCGERYLYGERHPVSKGISCETPVARESWKGSIDCIQLIGEEHVVSGADDGSVALWGLAKKKPLVLARQAHGMQDAQGLQQPYCILAVAALRNSDLLATGSHSASVKLWKCSEGFWKLEPLWAIPLVGFVNSLEFSAAGDFLVAGLGQEHRLGRWWRIKEAKNSICIIPLKRRATAPSSHVPDSS
ncbi:U3 small nucleolar RNA-interacting protein 2-like [Phalacrocorax aristotelis]|uniref:U3 small nucleolar RNA-interacting protein 2-like n=1 Tax=Phalacrocorax aristotelis TaxID=126867 RepID=UPI003F4BE805